MSRRPSKVVVSMEPRASVTGYETVSLMGSPALDGAVPDNSYRDDDAYPKLDEHGDSGGLLWKRFPDSDTNGRRTKRRRTSCERWPTLTFLFSLSLMGVSAVLFSLSLSHPTSTLKATTSQALSLVGLSTKSSNASLLWATSKAAYIYATPKPALEPYEKHPIQVLMERAKKEWEGKIARQSTTLKEAIAEYQRRYGRDPPKGFESWYNFASSNNVQMIDEYDSILTDLTPFLSLHPTTLKQRSDALTNRTSPNHVLIRISKGVQIASLGGTWRPAVEDNWKSLLEGFVEMLPDIEIPVYLHDGAHTSLDWEAKQGYREAARKGLFVDEDSLPIDGETEHMIRDRECAPDSRFRRVRTGVELQYPVGLGPPFVNRHHPAMDYCNNPEFMQLHGAVATTWDLGRLMPSFAMSKQSFNGDILWPAGILYELNPEKELPFLKKDIHKIVWRGSLDGIDVHSDNLWRSSHRYRLISLSSSKLPLPKTLRATAVDTFGREYQVEVQTTLKELNERYSDMRATGHPLQCDPGLCEAVQKETDWAEFMSKNDMSRHRYVMDVDGNSYSARFRTHLLSNQVPLKSTVFAGWYSERIQPWLHYVPTRVDYSDLYDILAFFDGDLTPERNGHHDKLAETIAMAGSEWAQTYWRKVDMQAYTFRLLLEYARILDSDRVAQGPTNYTAELP